MQFTDPEGLLQWSSVVTYATDATTGMRLQPFPGSRFGSVRDAAGAVTVVDWSVNSSCTCGGGGAEFDEFIVKFMTNVHIRASLPLATLAWAYKAEGDHVSDVSTWGNNVAMQIAKDTEAAFKGRQFGSIKECELVTSQALNAAFDVGGIDKVYQGSKEYWDNSGRHTWGGPNQRP